jgi:DNA repair protein RadA/Sms
MAKNSDNFYICNICNTQYKKWSGVCNSCNSWNTIIENTNNQNNFQILKQSNKKYPTIEFANLSEEIINKKRLLSNINEFDRAIGGGLVIGSAILLGGDPGIGKSTLIMQVISKLSNSNQCYYISGEESVDQLKGRALRLNVNLTNLHIASNNFLNSIIETLKNIKKIDVLVIDSIQTVYLEEVNSIAGSVSQVKACANELINFCKKQNIILILIGHVTREGQIAGPKMLEHMVDCVLYFEGERNNYFRILRAVKNRFGASDEIGVFEMSEQGLQEIDNPSLLFLSDTEHLVSGSSIFPALEGSRPILVEIQSLLMNTSFASPKRSTVGADLNRLSMIMAVLEARYNFIYNNKDVYLNIIGGLKITEPAADLAICASLISALKNMPINKETIFIGEISLSGQIRNVFNLEKRLKEAKRLGFNFAYIPKISQKLKQSFKTDIIKYKEVSNIFELIKLIT